MDPQALRRWLERYFRAWVSNDPEDVAALFTPDAVYWVGPFDEPRHSRQEIVERWVSGPQEDVEYAYEPLAVSGDVGVAHWNVVTRMPGDSERTELDGILLLTFAPDGRCREHREWFSQRTIG